MNISKYKKEIQEFREFSEEYFKKHKNQNFEISCSGNFLYNLSQIIDEVLLQEIKDNFEEKFEEYKYCQGEYEC